MKVPVNGVPGKGMQPRHGCGACRVCLSGDRTIATEFSHTIVYGLGPDTVKYLQYLAKMTMLEGDSE